MSARYPHILSESETLDRLLDGQSIARFGDGEWRCAIGGACTSQRAERGLDRELQQVLRAQSRELAVGLPNVFNGCPRKESWLRYTTPEFTGLLNTERYASSFITRPDNAPWIDTPTYWAKARLLWSDQDVILVVGLDASGVGAEKKSLTAEMLASEVKSLIEIIGPRQHAYAQIDALEAQILKAAAVNPATRVLLCLGVTATCLAARLARQGLHALDLGHMGMFLRHAGAYRYDGDRLVSRQYRLQLETLHAGQKWGADGAKHAAEVERIACEMHAATILDYGCGAHRLAEALKPRRVSGYDPGIPERAKMPKPCDLVICTDVLEHVEPDKLDAVLDHLYRLTARRCYCVIATRLANATLPDGRNAHLIVEPGDWWLAKLAETGFAIDRSESRGQKELAVWLSK